jgi:hypothetical protein
MKPTDQLTKQDEIDALRRFAAKWQPGSYLHSFFTDQLLQWVENQIKSDFPPDLYGNKEFQAGYENQSLVASVQRLEKEKKELRDQLSNARTENYALQHQILALNVDNKNLAHDVRDLANCRNMLTAMREDSNRLMAKASQMEGRIANAKRQLELAPSLNDEPTE